MCRKMLQLLATLVLGVVIGCQSSLAMYYGRHHQRDMVGSNMTTPELIQAMGYPAEIHYTTTEDGYILELHRIPHGRNGDSGEIKPVAYLQHCLLCSSADYIMNTPEKAIAYQLADAGYDVWLGNFRGNTYSKNHTTLTTDDNKFWKFSWDEMAYYDIPATIDYILSKTSQEDLYYLGFSMGSTTFLALMSERHEYADKVKVAALLAPAAYMEHLKGPLHDLAPYADDLDTILTLLGVGELLPDTELVDHFVNKYCDQNATTAEICYNFLFLISGPSEGEIDEEYLPVILSHTPAGTSVHTINHYAQLIASKNFQKYDFGELGNLQHYGQRTPPLYNLSSITVPIGMYWSDNDWLAPPEDVALLRNDLTSAVVDHEVEKELFSHMDFAWGMHADTLVYKYVFELFDQY